MAEIAEWVKALGPGSLSGWSLVALLIAIMLRQGPINRKLSQEREGNLLKERAVEMRGMRRRIIELEVEQRAERHERANLEQTLEMFLTLVESEPGRAQEWAQKMRKKMRENKEAVAVEKAAIFAARIAAAEEDEREVGHDG
jgi:hypothetical protein